MTSKTIEVSFQLVCVLWVIEFEISHVASSLLLSIVMRFMISWFWGIYEAFHVDTLGSVKNTNLHCSLILGHHLGFPSHSLTGFRELFRKLSILRFLSLIDLVEIKTSLTDPHPEYGNISLFSIKSA